ncbi:hypothetical protein [Aquipuribacter nitratireducens]|uniref:Uncharacterized protein n=1 Tax=Aquipuribacter nitratireducens TaxID=650104 RepID=A0ABW0GSQ2_9MICO
MSEGSRTGPLRRGVDATDRSRVAAVLGVVVADADAALVLDPRGRAFQRLEWQGDSALDAVLALHRWGDPACCADRRLEDLVSDAVLAPAAVNAGLPDLLDWPAGPERLADTVETCVGAGWHVGAQAAATVVRRLVHDAVDVVEVGPRPELADRAAALRCDGLGPPAHVGAYVCELSAADHAYARDDLADADEGRLSDVRALLLDGERVLQVAEDLGWLPGCGGPPRHVLDHVQARVGLVAVTAGLEAGVLEAGRLW